MHITPYTYHIETPFKILVVNNKQNTVVDTNEFNIHTTPSIISDKKKKRGHLNWQNRHKINYRLAY